MAEVQTDFYPKAPDPNQLYTMAGNVVGLANAAQQNQLLKTQNKQTHLDLVKDQVGQLVNVFSGLAADPNLSVDTIASQGQRLVDLGLIAPEQLATELKAIPPGATGDQLRQMMGNYALRALDAGQRFSAQYGTPQMVDTGNALVPSTVSPMTGIHPIGAPIQKTLSPSELATPATIGTTEQGQPITGTTGQLLEKAGVNPLTALPEPRQPTGNALVPPGPGVVTSLPAGDVAAMEQTGSAAGAALAAAREKESTFQQDIVPLRKSIAALEALGPTGTGPGTEQINEIKSFLQSMGVPGADIEGIKNFDEARKYLTQYAQSVGDTGTNDKLAAAFAGNPSVGISNSAAVDVAKTALALRRLQNAQLMAFEGAGLKDSQFTQFASQFNATQDPRAYGLDMMSPEARAKLIGDLKGEEKAKFVQSLKTAIALGLVQAPGAANGQ